MRVNFSIRLQAVPGSDVREAILDAKRIAGLLAADVCFDCNGIHVYVKPGSDVQTVLDMYLSALARGLIAPTPPVLVEDELKEAARVYVNQNPSHDLICRAEAELRRLRKEVSVQESRADSWREDCRRTSNECTRLKAEIEEKVRTFMDGPPPKPRKVRIFWKAGDIHKFFDVPTKREMSMVDATIEEIGD